MALRRSPLLFLLLLTLGLLTATAVAAAAPPDQVGPPAGVGPATHIVVFKDGVDPEAASADLVRAKGLTREFVYRYALNGASFIIPPGLEESVRSDPRVASIERNQIATVFAQTIPTGVDRIDAEGAGASGPVNVDIAVIDTGVDATHPDLYVYSRTDCTTRIFFATCKDGSGDDGNGHGSHVAGIAAAKNNDLGVRGVAPGARIWSVKVLGSNGSGYYSWIIAGVDWVTAHKSDIEVANMSIGGPPSADLDTAITNSVKAGVTYVVAAGNDAADANNYSPASNPDAITVSAVADSDGKGGGLGAPTGYGNDDTLATFSNYGSAVDIAAPGVNIYSTYKGGGYATMSGTSMASPHVAGAAALYKASNPSATPAQVKDALISAGNAQLKADPTYGFADRDSYAEPLVYVGSGTTTPPTNNPPTISDIADQTILVNTSTAAIPFTIGDKETIASSLAVSGASSNTSLVPDSSIVFGGSGSGRTVTVTPVAGAIGNATITVTVTDAGGATASDTFVLTVSASPPPPTSTPRIDTLSPTSAKGGSGTTLTITGAGFVNGAKVIFENGSGTAPAVVGSATVSGEGGTILATITTSKTPKDRTWDVRVTNPDGGTTVKAKAFTVLH